MHSQSVDYLDCLWPGTRKFSNRNKRLEEAGKTLNYKNTTNEISAGLDVSRAEEWSKWGKFYAIRPIRGRDLQELLDEGHEVLPTRWLDKDLNEHKRRKCSDNKKKKKIPLDLKSRLVGRGDFENLDGVRTDSPTQDCSGHLLLCSYAASNDLKVKTADISNAYFQGRELDRLILPDPPKDGPLLLESGKPDPEFEDGATKMVARVPIYGTPDAGRFFWKQMERRASSLSSNENEIARATFVCRNESGEIVAMLGTHVDDLLWTATKEGETVVRSILDKFNVRKVEEDDFRLCGKEIVQDKDISITITCRDTSEKLEPVRFMKGKRRMTEKASDAEIGQMRSVAGSLAWIARQCRPDLSYEVSHGQHRVSKSVLQDLKDINEAVKNCLETSNGGIVYKSKKAGSKVDWNTALMTSITDASVCQEGVIENGIEKRHRSQKAVMNCLTSPDILTNEEADVHIMNWQSVTDKKVCNSTLQAEAHAMISGTDPRDRFRGIINSMQGKLNLAEWENSNNHNPMKHLWLSDCGSLVSHLKNPLEAKLENTRLSIDMAALRQRLWADTDGEPYEELPEDDKANNIVRWIDTSVMIAHLD